KKMTAKKAKKIIDKLIEKGEILVVGRSKLEQKMCMRQLKNVGERRKKLSSGGHNGAKKRWENEENQPLKNGLASSEKMPSTSSSSSSSISPYSPPQGDEPLNQKERKKNGKRKSKKERVNDTIENAMLRSGFDPRAENQEHENQEHHDHDQGLF
ncbi:MAG: hypothetical protein MI685_09485, partial [Chlorobiales bacterium]|nr:hypothetical protein [Chlorobiales bacterium]